MTVVITIIAVLAAMVAPKVMTAMDTRNIISFINALPGLAGEARLAAIKDGQTAKMEFDSGRNALTVTIAETDGNDRQVDYLPVPKYVTADDFQQADQPASGGEWTIYFYPDGTSNGGAFQSNDKGILRTLVVDKTGISRIQMGPIPDTSGNSWAAGTYDVRTN